VADFDQAAATADLNQLAQNLAAASGVSFEPVAAQLVREVSEDVASDARQRAPRKTGALAGSITVVFTSPLTAIVGPTKKYGVFQEFGTGSRGEMGGSAYVIRPVRATKLRFQVNGKWVYAREVHHPGIPPHPYMRPAAQAQVGKLAGDMGVAGVRLIVTGK
jgi:hypothetical protein